VKVYTWGVAIGTWWLGRAPFLEFGIKGWFRPPLVFRLGAINDAKFSYPMINSPNSKVYHGRTLIRWPGFRRLCAFKKCICLKKFCFTFAFPDRRALAYINLNLHYSHLTGIHIVPRYTGVYRYIGVTDCNLQYVCVDQVHNSMTIRPPVPNSVKFN
jgi:hypothetical protein